MLLFDILLSGLILGGMYALVAMGLSLQYGVARILNLAYGEVVVAACFGAYVLFTAASISPLAGLAIVMPLSFAANWLVYRVMLLPLVGRAKTRAALDQHVVPPRCQLANRPRYQPDAILVVFYLFRYSDAHARSPALRSSDASAVTIVLHDSTHCARVGFGCPVRWRRCCSPRGL